jgi:hypothetical protein
LRRRSKVSYHLFSTSAGMSARRKYMNEHDESI